MRHISFALTTDQIRNRTKTVTRRIGWTFLKPGALLQPVEKCQGLKKGEQVTKIGGPIKVVSVRRESLNVLGLSPSDYEEIEREGFPGMAPYVFRVMFAESHHCSIDADVTRIEFTYENGGA